MPTLEITTVVGCPLMCTFCPQDELREAYAANGTKQLSLSDFALILGKIPPHVFIHFSGMSEPWANPRATDMLELTLNRGFSVALYTTLDGMTLNDSDRVVRMLTAHERQFDHMCLHLPDANLNMRGWRFSPDYAAVLSRVLELQSLGPGLYGPRIDVMTMDRSGSLHPSLKSYRGAVTHKNWRGHSRAGNLSPQTVAAIGADLTPHHATAVNCGYTPFYDQNVLLPNGDVVLCCMDYSLKHRIGNLLEQEYDELFLSPELAAIRVENAKPRSCDRTLCKSCAAAQPVELRGSDWFTPIPFRDTLRNLAPSFRRGMVRRAAKGRSG